MKDCQLHDDRWAAQKNSSPAVKRFNAAVDELMRVRGLSREVAWAEAKRQNLQLFEQMAVNELPPGAELSADTQRLIPDWPVPPAVLGALGLPTSATREHYLIFRAAERVKTVTPEIAAKIVVTLIRFQQLTQGMKFDDTFVALKENFPDIFAALKEAGRGT